MIATPPISLPNLSCSFSFSNAELALSSCILISSALEARDSSPPLPSIIVVVSFSTDTFLAEPNN